MKKFALPLVIALFTFIACSSNQSADKVVEATFEIEGMTCQMGCANAIEDRLADLVGVKHVDVNFSGNSATVQYSSSDLDQEAIVYEVESTNGGGKYFVSNYKVSSSKTGTVKDITNDEENTGGNSIYIPTKISFPNVFQLLPIR